MTRPRHIARLGAALLAAAAAGCAHGPAMPSAPVPAWPDGAPAVRWSGVYPPESRDETRSFWSRVKDGVLGSADDASVPAQALNRPFGLATDGANLLVADPDARRVLRVQRRGGAMVAVECSGRAWISPIAVAAGADGATFVADAGAVVRVDAAGGCTAFGEGAVERPTGLAWTGDRLYVVDPPAHRVLAFTADGREALRFGSRGDGPGELSFPTAIAAAPDGTLLVVDALNFRIARFSSAGEFLGAFGDEGDGDGHFGRPKAVAVDARGRVYVTDAALDAVLVFEASGAYAFAIGQSGAGRGEFVLPAGIAVLDRTMFVADSYNARVQVLDLVGDGR